LIDEEKNIMLQSVTWSDGIVTFLQTINRKGEQAMRLTMIISLMSLLAISVWAGTFRDDFEDGKLDKWQKEVANANGKVEEKGGKLIVTDIDKGRLASVVAVVNSILITLSLQVMIFDLSKLNPD